MDLGATPSAGVVAEMDLVLTTSMSFCDTMESTNLVFEPNTELRECSFDVAEKMVRLVEIHSIFVTKEFFALGVDVFCCVKAFLAEDSLGSSSDVAVVNGDLILVEFSSSICLTIDQFISFDATVRAYVLHLDTSDFAQLDQIKPDFTQDRVSIGEGTGLERSK